VRVVNKCATLCWGFSKSHQELHQEIHQETCTDDVSDLSTNQNAAPLPGRATEKHLLSTPDRAICQGFDQVASTFCAALQHQLLAAGDAAALWCQQAAAAGGCCCCCVDASSQLPPGCWPASWLKQSVVDRLVDAVAVDRHHCWLAAQAAQRMLQCQHNRCCLHGKQKVRAIWLKPWFVFGPRDFTRKFWN